MNKPTRRTFSAELKLEAASLITEQRYSVREASQAMNVGRSTLARWLQQLRSEQQRLTPKAKPITSEQQKIRELEKKIERIQLRKIKTNLVQKRFQNED